MARASAPHEVIEAPNRELPNRELPNLELPSLDEIDGLTVLQALSDPVRLEIVRQLSGCSGSSELKCSQIELPVTKSTASHHFKILLAAGLVTGREQGTSKFMRLRRDELDERFPGLLDSVLRATG